MQLNNVTNHYEKYCTTILNLDDSLRTVGKIVNRKVVSQVRRPKFKALLNDELTNMAHHQVLVRGMMDSMFDESLGKTNWAVTSKEKVKLITIFQHDGMLIISTEPYANHVEIIQKIESLKL
jgi:hypothetical protein